MEQVKHTEGDRSGSPGAGSGEMQATLTLIDFFRAFYEFRRWFIIGLLVVAIGTFAWVKLFVTKYYEARATILVAQRQNPEGMGIADLQVFQGDRNSQFQTVVSSAVAEQVLLSGDLITTVTQQMASGADGQGAVDLFAMLGIEDNDRVIRESRLIKVMNDNLLNVRQLGTTGMVVFSVELPDPVAAARFANLAVAQLQRVFIELNFGYWDEALRLYETQLKEQMALRGEWSSRLKELNVKSYYDQLETVAQERAALEAQLESQAELIGEISTMISSFRLATNPQAKQAGQPAKVIDRKSTRLNSSHSQQSRMPSSA